VAVTAEPAPATTAAAAATASGAGAGVGRKRKRRPSASADGEDGEAVASAAGAASSDGAAPAAEGDEAWASEVGAALADYFHLGVDVAPLTDAWAAADPRMAQIVAALPGMRILRQPPLECLLSFIASSNNNIARIQQVRAGAGGRRGAWRAACNVVCVRRCWTGFAAAGAPRWPRGADETGSPSPRWSR
jgi:hypothetical protein